MSTPLGNPFTPGTEAPPARFFGREALLDTIFSQLQNMQSLSLVGEARIGKTSLLKYLVAHLPAQLAPYGRYQPIYLSMNGLRDPGMFYHALLTALLPQLPPGAGDERDIRMLDAALARNEPPSQPTTERVLDWAAAAGLRVVLLLDEFKDLLELPAVFDHFFCAWLRSLYSARRVALVMATRQPISEIPGLKLYFLNASTATHTLGPLDLPASEALLRQPHDRPFSPSEVQLGLRAGKLHPCRLQLAGDYLYRGKGLRHSLTHTPDGSLRREAGRILQREVAQSFEEMQRRSRPRPTRRNWWRWFEALGTTAINLGEGANTLSARILGVVIVVIVLILVAGCVAWAFGLIDGAAFRKLINTVTGAN
ncbi:MAG: ATP-binding protein [Chloroflexales bacterium]